MTDCVGDFVGVCERLDALLIAWDVFFVSLGVGVIIWVIFSTIRYIVE